MPFLACCVMITHRQTGKNKEVRGLEFVLRLAHTGAHTRAVILLTMKSRFDFFLVAKFSPTEPFYGSNRLAEGNSTLQQRLLKSLTLCVSHCARMILSDTAPFLPPGHSEAVSWL